MNKKLIFSLALAVVLLGGTVGTASAECGLCGIHWPSCLSLCNIHLPSCFTCGAPARDLDRTYVAPSADLTMDRDLDRGAFINTSPGPYPYRYDYNVRNGLTNEFGLDKNAP